MSAFLYIIAAPKSFSVQAPKWTKLAVCETEGVNIRKSPSTAAPRLVSKPDPDEYWIPLRETSYWSAAKVKSNETVITFEGRAPILSETDGWYELEGIGPSPEVNGWVSSKYCDVVEPRPVVPGQYNTSDFTWIKNTANSDGGKYAIYCAYNEMDGFCVFYVGREMNGFLICPYAIACHSLYDPKEECGIKKNEYAIEFNYGEKESTGNGFDLSKVPAKAIDSIISAAEKMDNPVVIYRMNGVYCATDYLWFH